MKKNRFVLAFILVIIFCALFWKFCGKMVNQLVESFFSYEYTLPKNLNKSGIIDTTIVTWADSVTIKNLIWNCPGSYELEFSVYDNIFKGNQKHQNEMFDVIEHAIKKQNITFKSQLFNRDKLLVEKTVQMVPYVAVIQFSTIELVNLPCSLDIKIHAYCEDRDILKKIGPLKISTSYRR
jgi:hypothetical protein